MNGGYEFNSLIKGIFIFIKTKTVLQIGGLFLRRANESAFATPLHYMMKHHRVWNSTYSPSRQDLPNLRKPSMCPVFMIEDDDMCGEFRQNMLLSGGHVDRRHQYHDGDLHAVCDPEQGRFLDGLVS